MIGVHLDPDLSAWKLRLRHDGVLFDTAIRRETGVILMGDERRLLITPPLVFTAEQVTRTVEALRSIRSVP